MRKPLFFALLFLMFQHSVTYAQDADRFITPSKTIQASFSSNISAINPSDDWATSVTIYSLIIGIYALYWFRQKT